MNNKPQYYHVDTGCSKATKHLKKQSRCLECPFKDCENKSERPPSKAVARVKP